MSGLKALMKEVVKEINGDINDAVILREDILRDCEIESEHDLIIERYDEK